jgi:hypothetical protein
MAKGWKVTVRPMTILEFMDDMSTVITDVSFWMEWQGVYEEGGRFYGWDVVKEDRGMEEYRRRLALVQKYMLYRGWWKKEMSKPRHVSWDEGEIGNHRKGKDYEK